MKKIILILALVLLFSCKHKEDEIPQQEKPKQAYIKTVSVASQNVDIDTWKVSIPYKSRAIDKDDFDVKFSIPNVDFTISPMPLTIEAGKSATATISSPNLLKPQQIEITMEKSEHILHIVKPQDGFFTVKDEEGNVMADGASCSNGTIIKLNANPKLDTHTVDCYTINGKRMFYGKELVEFEVREDITIKVSFVKKDELSFVSVVDSGNVLVIKKDKWVDYLGWEDYPDIYIEPYAIGRAEVTYPFAKRIYEWAQNNGYKFNNSVRNAIKYTSASDFVQFPEDDGNIYPATGLSQMDMWAWCNALTEYTNKQHEGEEGWVPLEYVYKHDGTRSPFNRGEPFKRSEVYFPKITMPAPPEAYTQLQTAIETAASIIIDRKATGYRLQSRFEWIVAARGGNPNSEAWNYKWPGSNDLSEVTNFFVKGVGKLKSLYPVCSKKPNTLGLYDMVGNADEWTDSKHTHDPLANCVVGHSSTDEETDFEKEGWFQELGGGLGYPWGGSATLGGGTNGWPVTGFRLVMTLK